MSKKKKSVGKRILTVLAIILLVLIIIVSGGLAAGYGYISSKLGKMQHVELVEEELNISKTVEDKYRNVAIFGVDSRSSNLGKGNRSDCIIIASLNNETKEVRLISVYRDSYLEIDGYGLDKVTHAYSYGEAPLAIKTLNKNLDLNIKEFVTVNFDAVAEAVDALGGIEMDLTSEEVKYLNNYIDETANVTGKSHAKVTSAGKQTLNGVQAVAYSRIRYTEGGDAKRTERMRDVIEAMAKKARTLSVGEINDLLDQILPLVYTNISVSDILALLPDAMNYKITDSIGWPYETRGITLDRWYGVPVTLESNVEKLHTNCFDGDYTVPDEVKEISDKIISRTGYTE
ncbi:MAG: LCP family protein [Clostridia bacterium]|nr:LCP family protein [Clostridia bacterium]